jgi:hypothetical protein
MEEKVGFYEYPSSHGKELLFKTPLQHFFLLFSEAEILELCDVITETLLVLKHDLYYQTHKLTNKKAKFNS